MPSSSKALTPLRTPPPRAPLAPANAGNTCYIDSVLIALFADFDGWDGLLAGDTSSRLVTQLRAIVNLLRDGKFVSAERMSLLRDTLISTTNWPPGTAQHDAAELFSTLLDALHAPFVPLVKNLHHAAASDDVNDHAPFTERVLWLDTFSAPDGVNDLRAMVDNYFYSEVLHGLMRSGGGGGGGGGQRGGDGVAGAHAAATSTVDATVSRSLIPAYSPVRETGETVLASRDRFHTLTVPFGVKRFTSGDGTAPKLRRRVRIPTALAATRYVSPFANGACHTLMLRSVVCHLGATMRHGHYVAFTYSPAVGWRRWDDMEREPVRSVKGDVLSGAPEDAVWARQIEENCYLVFYELVPGDEVDMLRAGDRGGRRTRVDEMLAAQRQAEEDMCSALREQMLSEALGPS